MELVVRFINVESCPEVLDHAKRRLRFALGRFANKVRRVTVRLSDQNGPRGGVDLLARATVELSGSESVVVTVTEENPRRAIDRVSGRAARAVVRALDRQRRHDGTRLSAALHDGGSR